MAFSTDPRFAHTLVRKALSLHSVRMSRLVPVSIMLALAVLLLPGHGHAQNRTSGSTQVLVTVNGRPITYHQIVGDRDMQAEINALRQTRGRALEGVPDSRLEEVIVSQSVTNYVLQQLLDAEADKLMVRVTDTIMRGVLARERKAARIAEGDDQAWAAFLKTRYGMTPAEYREKRRTDLRRSEALYALAGARGALPNEAAAAGYFSLAVTPRDVRRAFEATSIKWRVSRNIDFEQFKLYFPEETPYDVVQKLEAALMNDATGVYPRVKSRGESMEASTDGLRKLLDEQRYPGVRYTIQRTRAKDNTELDADTYRLVQSPNPGDVSLPSALSEEDEDGGKFQVITFVKVFSREDGDLRNFEDVQVQEAIRNELFQRRFQENRAKVEQALLHRAAIVPRSMINR